MSFPAAGALAFDAALPVVFEAAVLPRGDGVLVAAVFFEAAGAGVLLRVERLLAVFLLAAVFFVADLLVLLADFLVAGFFVAVFRVTVFLVAAFFPAVVPVAFFPAAAFLGAAFFAAAFFTAAFLGAAFRAAGFLAAGFLAAVFFAAVFLVAVFPAALRVRALLLAATFFVAVFLPAAFFAAVFFTLAFFTVLFLAVVFLAVEVPVADFFAAGLRVAVFLTAFFAVDLPEADFAETRVLPAFAARAVVVDARPAESCLRAVDWVLRALLEALRVDFAMLPHHCRLAAGCYSLDRSHQQPPYTRTPAAVGTHPGNALTRIILFLIGLYKRLLSPLLGQRCRFHPTCSDYARIAVARFGPLRGAILAGWRILRCQPLCSGGMDPVPDTFHLARCRDHETES